MLNSSECAFLSESDLSVKRRGTKCGTYTIRAGILIFQERSDGHPGHLKGIPFILRQVPQLQCELRNNILDESKFLCQKQVHNTTACGVDSTYPIGGVVKAFGGDSLGEVRSFAQLSRTGPPSSWSQHLFRVDRSRTSDGPNLLRTVHQIPKSSL